MGFQSILFDSAEPDLSKEMPDFFHDLQLDYLLEHILSQTEGYETAPYFFTFPGSGELIAYRQQIGKDMEAEELCTVVRSFCRRMQESRNIYNLSLESKGEVQAANYHLQAATLYWEAICKFSEELRGINITSKGFLELKEYIEQELALQREMDMRLH